MSQGWPAYRRQPRLWRPNPRPAQAMRANGYQRIDVGKVRRSAEKAAAIGRSEKGIRCCDYAVASPHARNQHGDMKRRGGVVHGDGVRAPVCGKALLELPILGPQVNQSERSAEITA